MIRALVMTHGNIGSELIAVVQMILGSVEGLTAMSNAGCSAIELQANVEGWLAAGEAGVGEIIFIDDYGGSCAHAAMLACGKLEHRAIISGVNLAMLLGYVTWRGNEGPRELAAKIVQKGRESIVLMGNR